jgi:hypothetical protein
MSSQAGEVFWKIIRGAGNQEAQMSHLAEFIATAPLSEFKDIVDQIKAILKSKTEAPGTKLLALKVTHT